MDSYFLDEYIRQILVDTESVYLEWWICILATQGFEKCSDLPIFAIDSMKHRDHEIIGVVFCEKSIESSREVVEIARMSGNNNPIIHIGSTAEGNLSFRGCSSSEDSDVHRDIFMRK